MYGVKPPTERPVIGVVLGSAVVVTLTIAEAEDPVTVLDCTWQVYAVPAVRPPTIPECDVTLNCVPLSTAWKAYLPRADPHCKIESDAAEVCQVTCAVVADALQFTLEIRIVS